VAGGGLPVATHARPVVGAFAGKIAEWVARSRGKVRADVAHQRLVAMGYMGSERTTRRAVAEAKRRWRSEHGRRTRPWIVEPGLWLQWDYGDGPRVGGRSTALFCAWLAWSRFRVVLPLWDKTTPSVVMGLDRALRAFGGAPTYALTDNERTVSIDHVCGIAVRNPQIVGVARHYGLTIATCVPADPESKGGSEATVRIARADLVPTDCNLREEYRDFGELEAECLAFCERVNAREHRITRRPPVVMMAEEQGRLHRLPAAPHTVCFGETRRVNRQSTISVGGAIYSVPSKLVDERVWVRVDGVELVVVHADGPEGPREVARHGLTTPGRPSIRDEHYPPRPAGALERKPRAQGAEERAFLAIGPSAERWLIAAAAAGTTKLRRKLAEAVDLAKLHGRGDVDEALGIAAQAGRFGEGDLAAILAHRGAQVIEFPAPASEQQSLQRSTRSWEGFGR
jgi:transposase